MHFDENSIAEIKNSKEFVLIEASYLPHLQELQSLLGSKAFFATSSFKLYKQQGKLLCLCYTGDRVDYSHFMDLLLPSLKASSCTASTISLNPLNAFKTEEPVDSSVLRCLSTVKVQGIEQLETPNFITGLSAAIATNGKFYDYPFTSYVLYMNDFDQDSSQKLTTIFDKLGISLNLKPQIVSNANSLYI